MNADCERLGTSQKSRCDTKLSEFDIGRRSFTDTRQDSAPPRHLHIIFPSVLALSFAYFTGSTTKERSGTQRAVTRAAIEHLCLISIEWAIRIYMCRYVSARHAYTIVHALLV